MTSTTPGCRTPPCADAGKPSARSTSTARTVALDPAGPLAEAAWAKQRLARDPSPAQRLLRAADATDLPARQRVPDLPDVPHHPRVPAPAPRSNASRPCSSSPPPRPAARAACCAALKMPMSAALWVPMVWGEKTPPGGAAAGFSSVWCRLWSAWCRWCQSMTSVTAERAALSSTRFLPPANAATRDCSAMLLTARG